MTSPLGSRCRSGHHVREWMTRCRVSVPGGIALLCLLGTCVLPNNLAHGQIVFAAPVDAPATEATAKTDGFDLGIDESLQSVVEDFERFARRGMWEKAIEALEQVEPEKLENGLLASGDGFVLPAGEQLWRLQANLSGDFREAFRVFLNAKAKKLFESALADGVKPAERDKLLKEVYQTYFVSAVGDEASNLLGDKAFRDGRFNEAIRHWQQVMDYHPDSEITEPWLVFKIGVGAIQANDRDTLSQSLRTLRERFPDTIVRFAGEDVVAPERLAKLSEQVSAKGNTATEEAVAGPISVPEKLTVAWRHEIATDAMIAKMAASEQQYWRYKGIATFVPPTAVDGNAVVYNFYGSTNAVDLTTGKLKWRQNDPADAIEKISGNIYQFTVDAYGIGAGGGRTVSRYIPPDEMNYYRAGADLVVYETETGRQRWEVGLTKRGQSEWYHVGRPYVQPALGDGVPTTYVVAVKSGGGELYLRVHEGKKSATAEIKLGRYREIDVEDYNDKLVPTPQIIGFSDDGYLLVGVDEGALLAIDVDQKKVAWGFRYQAPRLKNGNQNYNQGRTLETTIHPRSSYFLAGRHLYLKDSARPWLVALDLGKRKPVWTRRIVPTCEIVSVDEDHIYLLGQELLAINRESGGLEWAARLPMENSGLSAAMIGESILVFTGRGLYELNRTDGSVVQIHREVEFDSNGGRVMLAGDRLITVSERNITAWDLAGNTGPANAASTANPATAANETNN